MTEMARYVLLELMANVALKGRSSTTIRYLSETNFSTNSE
jgi:hypothetical protein